MRSEPDKVPVGPLREAFLRSGLSAGDVAARAGVFRTVKGVRIGDSTWTKRKLGLREEVTNGHRYRYLRQDINYETAVKLCRAMDAYPVDVGI